MHSDFLSMLDSKPYENIKNRSFKNENSVRTLNYHLLFRKGYRPQFRKEETESVATSSIKTRTYLIKDED